MTVASILKAKGANVVTIQPGTLIREAVRLLQAQKIGAVIVLGPGRRILGILSERDIVAALAKVGGAALDASVDDHMTTAIQSCRPEDSIAHVMEIMTHGRFRHVPVMDGGNLVGIVSIGDVVKRRIDDAQHETEALKRYIVAS